MKTREKESLAPSLSISPLALDPLKPLSDPFGRVQIFRDGYSLCRFGRSGEEDNWIKKNKTSAPTSRKAEVSRKTLCSAAA